MRNEFKITQNELLNENKNAGVREKGEVMRKEVRSLVRVIKIFMGNNLGVEPYRNI